MPGQCTLTSPLGLLPRCACCPAGVLIMESLEHAQKRGATIIAEYLGGECCSGAVLCCAAWCAVLCCAVLCCVVSLCCAAPVCILAEHPDLNLWGRRRSCIMCPCVRLRLRRAPQSWPPPAARASLPASLAAAADPLEACCSHVLCRRHHLRRTPHDRPPPRR